MKGDFSRLTFRPERHFRSVRMQQGRVQLDADWNEQVDIEAHVDETTTLDVVGPHGGPIHDAAFAILCDDDPIPAAGCAAGHLFLSAGRYYVDGLLCEVEEPVALGDQPDLPDVGLPADGGGDPTRYVAYLDVWEEHVTVLEEADLREVALGGPDTTTRSRIVWQVKLQDADDLVCSDFEGDWVPDGAAGTGRLRAQAAEPGPLVDPCLIPPGAGFRRLENQLYRVEIHDGSEAAGGPTYKWSRDNGSVVTGLVDITDTVITVAEPGRDDVLGFAAGQWVELSDEGRTLRGEPGILVQLDRAQGTELTVSAWPGGAAPDMTDFGDAPTVRRWDSDGALPVTRGAFLDLEDGVQVEFENDGGQEYRTGDHWEIPARTANLLGGTQDLGGDVEWPQNGAGPAFLPRQGVLHHYAPVALLERSGATWTLESDCRRLFPPLTELAEFFVVGGDGQEAMPGHDIPQLLEVGVTNGRWPVDGATVRFTASNGGRVATDHAGLGAAGGTVTTSTDANGIAGVAWRLDPDVGTPSQQVEAVLLDDHEAPIGLPIRFDGNLSIAAEVWYDPGSCENLAGVETVQEALDRLSQSAWLEEISGDGQEAMPERPLPKDLVVQVTGDCGPVPKATVVFTAEDGGRVAATDADLGAASETFEVATAADGTARCRWMLAPDRARPAQELRAELTAVPDDLFHQPAVHVFTANLSLAQEVWFDAPDGCLVYPEQETVADALTGLARAASLVPLAGDGQEGLPGDELPVPLFVQVVSDCGPVGGVMVVFKPEDSGTVRPADGGGAAGAPTLEVLTDGNGRAGCLWTPANNPDRPVQHLVAELDAGDLLVVPPTIYAFTATLGFDRRIAYTGDCEALAEAGTVQEALDRLCELGGHSDEAGMHVIRLALRSTGDDLGNDTEVKFPVLQGGILISFDRAVAPESMSQPTCFLTLELPFPLSPPDLQAWPNVGPVGFEPMIVTAEVRRFGVRKGDMLWFPAGTLTGLLQQVFGHLAEQKRELRVLARLTLKGGFIWSLDDPPVFLDGDTFGAPGNGTTDLLPFRDGSLSGDGRRGGDFEMWFWLVP